MMKFQFFLLFVWVGVGCMHVSLAEGEADPFCPRLVLKELIVKNEDECGKPAPAPVMQLRFALENRGDWRIAWCEAEQARVSIEDSEGERAADVKCCFSPRFGIECGDFRLLPQGWRPSSGAKWVRAKGEVPVAFFRVDDTSMPVAMKPVKGYAVPVVLKGAGVRDGGAREEDVRAVLSVEGVSHGARLLDVKLTSPRFLGIRSIELQTKDGIPVEPDSFVTRGTFKDGRYTWSCTYLLKEEQAEEYEAVVRYAKEWRVVSVKVDSHAALSGLAEAGMDSANRHAAKAAGADMRGEKAIARGKNPAVTMAWKDFSIGVAESFSGTGKGDFKLHEGPVRLHMTAGLSINGPFVFGDRLDKMEQRLEVTDSMGHVLKPADELRFWAQSQFKDGRSGALLSGWWPELASPGAEWVRFKGVFNIPVSEPRESAIYELPFGKGAELQLPVPGMNDVADQGDIAVAGAGPVCTLRMEGVSRGKNQDVTVEISLSVEGATFGLIGFVFVDEQGLPFQVDRSNWGSSKSEDHMTWTFNGMVKKAGGDEKLRVKLCYKAATKLVPVPVDFKLGLGGAVPQQGEGARK